MELFIQLIAKDLQITVNQVSNTLRLLKEGATIPFISRYRKEWTGGLDEIKIEQIKESHSKYSELEKRKKTILCTIEELGKLTPELQQRINNSWSSAELEDIYLPYKPKRKTRAEAARQQGLEPLANIMLMQREADIINRSKAFINKEVANEEEALKGARDILAEMFNENERARNQVRNAFARQAILTSKVVKGKEEEGIKYRDYFDYSEPLKRCSSHRLLAIRRGESEGFLKVTIAPNDDDCQTQLERLFIKSSNECGNQVKKAIHDAYKRLLKPSIETEFSTQSKEKADSEAIRIFSENLKQLLLASPLGQKRVMGIDPGFRTGCKIVCLDAQGILLHHSIIAPHPPKNQILEAKATIKYLVEKYTIEAIAIGNGTAGRETEQFIKSLTCVKNIEVYSVSEDGASVYSASKIAREEFPDYDVTVRGAVSIGRRLMDPLAELVKIDPKSIGVGQYQHDVDQNKLKQSLNQTVENCVNTVGVNVNTASKHLLTYVSGLGPQLAKNIVDYRTENGPFYSREQLMKVPRMGSKAFEQCAGFLRIPEAQNPLDNSAVHPESYHIVECMAHDMGCSVKKLMEDKNIRSHIDLTKYCTDIIGLPTLQDIMQELDKPGRDPRKPLTVFEFANVHSLEELHKGMVLPGIITNITNFGCFVDVGVHQDGLVHISQLTNKYVSDPTTVVSLRQQVMVKVLDIDLTRKRLNLSMKDV